VKLGNCLPECFAPNDQAGCLAGLAFFTIDPWGQVRPCNHAELVCGNILDQSVAEIWGSTNMAWWRDFNPEPCKTCSAFVQCRGGCKAQALATRSDADPLMRSPMNVPSKRQRQRWEFYEQARPLGRFDQHPEQFGSLLVSGNRLMPVSHNLLPILDQLDGQATLRQIEGEYGSAGLELVASLYDQGMVEFRS